MDLIVAEITKAAGNRRSKGIGETCRSLKARARAADAQQKSKDTGRGQTSLSRISIDLHVHILPRVE